MGENSVLTKQRWTTLWISCIVNVVIGTGYAWSVFGAAWAAKLGISPGEAALAFTICNAVGPITMITGGKINDALGPKWVIFIGGLCVMPFLKYMIKSDVPGNMNLYVLYHILRLYERFGQNRRQQFSFQEYP